jgi:hypothetical protein
MTKKEKRAKEFNRDSTRLKKMSLKKITKLLIKCFKKLNNKKCYKFFKNDDSKSYHNLLDFLSLLEKKCEKIYGERSKYSKAKVAEVLQDIFSSPTKIECKTLNKINKFLKKTTDEQIVGFKFDCLFKGKRFEKYLEV